MHALQARISRLRSALPLKVELVNGGYRLDPASIRTDSERFESLLEQGGLLLADGALAQAADSLRQALDLWRGPAFADVPPIVALSAESARLEKLRSAALADRVDLDLALGRADAVVPELAALVAERPLFERHWGQLMTALYQGGRAQEALEVYARVRALFADRLGVEPSGELGRLHTQILRDRPAGSLLRLPVATPVLDAATPAAESTNGPSGMPVTSSRPDAVADLLREHRALLLTGPAGIGKTQLLRTVGARFQAQHCWAPLFSASALSHAIPLGVFAGTTGSGPSEQSSPPALIDFFARHRSTTVLLVDNVEQLDDASLFVVSHLIRSAQLPAIVTARNLTEAPDEIRALYDSGALTEVGIGNLNDDEAGELAAHITGGQLTPDARRRLREIAEGNPLHVRELVSGSLADGNLMSTEHGWKFRGSPTPTPRLTQLVGERFSRLDEATVDAAAMVAIAGEFPADQLGDAERRALARTDILALADSGWLRLAHPLDKEVLRSRCSAVLWRDLTAEVVRVLRSGGSASRPEAQHRAHVLALDLDDPIDVPGTIALAERALSAFDERLALRAAEAAIAQEPQNSQAHRIAGLAASALGLAEAAESSFGLAGRTAANASEHTAVALAHAQHRGLRYHDAVGALGIIDDALRVVGEAGVVDKPQAAHLRIARARWAAVAGMAGETALAPEAPSGAADVFALITTGFSSVITGPLDEAQRVLELLGRMPKAAIELVPGGASLIDLTEVMALSNTGDVVSTESRLRHKISEAQSLAPETLGMWEYALGFSELLAGDAARARAHAESAVTHLKWRDLTGLLPAATALTAAAAEATGHGSQARALFDSVPEAALHDPKVVMLRAWSNAWRENSEGAHEEAARTLVDAASWLLAAQHNYFAGMLAHCAVRTGSLVEEAVVALRQATLVAGGGLLELLLGHGEATASRDQAALDEIARDAQELGLASTATDTWMSLLESPENSLLSRIRSRRQQVAVDRLRAANPGMPLWAKPVRDSATRENAVTAASGGQGVS